MKMGRTAEGQAPGGEMIVEKLRMDVDNGEGILMPSRNGEMSWLAEANLGVGPTMVCEVETQ